MKANKQLLTAVTAANSPPSAVTDGISLDELNWTDEGSILVKDTAGSGTMTVTLALWGYSSLSGAWHKMGDLNDGVAIAETSSDDIEYAEPVVGLRDFQRLYLEVVAIAGTSTAISAWLQVGR